LKKLGEGGVVINGMNTAGSASRVSAGLETLWDYDQPRSRAASQQDNGRHQRLRIVAVMVLFALMGAAMAWVFERLSPDVPFMPYGGFSSSSLLPSEQIKLTEN
jgi:hypothetical protein